MIFLQESACSSSVVTLYPIESIVWSQETAFAEAVIADVKGLGRCLFLDQEIQSCETDEDIYHECLVHPLLSACKRDKILVIGGGEGATVREVLKWGDVGHVDWVDIDKDLVEACRVHLPWGQGDSYTDPRVTYFPMDIRKFFKDSNTRYDAVIVDLPDPDPDMDPASDALLNAEFWRELYAHLAPEGGWVSHTGPVRRQGPSGAQAIQRALSSLELPTSHHEYHAVIPAFQDDWGWMMNKAPGSVSVPVRFLTAEAMDFIFRWPYSRFSVSPKT